MPDAGGHGTHVAGIIAGNSTRADLSGRQVDLLLFRATLLTRMTGHGARANLIDVRVLDPHGDGRISSVIAGIQWVIGNKARYNIRGIINLSLSAPISASYRQDPLSAAVEVAWREGSWW